VSRKLGILGGSFDPIHLGHLRCAEEVREALDLERIVFVPAASPPHKPGRRLADAASRLAMVELAIADNPRFAVSDLELERSGISYSVDTLERFREREPEAALHFIIGADAFREVQTWRDVPRLFELASVVVANRPPDRLETTIAHLPVAAREAFCYDPLTLSYRHRSGTELRFVAITALDVSATAIRRRVHEGLSIRYLVPAGVERFIRERQLYRTGEPTG
jgi:nicotinate-nucleotide adenylyltransferase